MSYPVADYVPGIPQVGVQLLEFQRFNGLRVEQTHGELFGCNIIILNMIVCSRFVVVVLLLLFHLEKDRRPLSCLCHCFVLRSFCVVDRRLKS